MDGGCHKCKQRPLGFDGKMVYEIIDKPVEISSDGVDKITQHELNSKRVHVLHWINVDTTWKGRVGGRLAGLI